MMMMMYKQRRQCTPISSRSRLYEGEGRDPSHHTWDPYMERSHQDTENGSTLPPRYIPMGKEAPRDSDQSKGYQWCMPGDRVHWPGEEGSTGDDGGHEDPE